MIVFVVTPEHPYTVQAVAEQSPGLDIRIETYDKLFGLSELPRATYIFTDLDRLPQWRVRLAAKLYRQLRDGRTLAVDCKRPSGKPTPEQIAFLRCVRANGGVALVARSVDDLLEALA